MGADSATGMGCPILWSETDDALILRISCQDLGTATITSTPDTTDVVNSLGNNSGGVTLSITEEDQASAGYVAFKRFATSTTNEEFFCMTLALRSTSTAAAYPAQPVVRNVQQRFPNTSIALVYPPPHGLVDDDLLVMIQSCDTTGCLAPPMDFDSIQDSSNTAVFHQAYYKVAASESGDYTGSDTDSVPKLGALLRIVNADPAAPINTSSVATGTSSAPTASTITPSVDNCLLLFTAGADDDDSDLAGQPSGYTDIWTTDTTIGADLSHIIAMETQTSAAATGSVAGALAASEEWVAINIAITPGVSEATTYSFSGASSGVILVASANITLTPTSGTWPAGITITLSDDATIPGSFSDSTLNPSAGTSTPISFTYTPAELGTININADTGGAMTDPSDWAYESVVAPTFVAAWAKGSNTVIIMGNS